MGYAKALEKLESLPPDEQELASGMYVFEMRDGKPHCGCAIGKLLTEEQRAALARCSANEANVGRLNRWLGRDDSFASMEGMTFDELRALQRENDYAAGKSKNDTDSRRERYRIVIDWLRKHVAGAQP